MDRQLNSKILLVDDEVKLRELLGRLLTLEGYAVTETGSIGQARKQLEMLSPDIVLCDVKLPDGSGVDFVLEVKQQLPFAEMILLTAYGNISDGVQAMKNGAYDYITKGNDNDKLLPLLSKALKSVRLKKKLAHLEKLVGSQGSFDSLIGKSQAFLGAVDMAKKVAVTDANVILLGETGTGKELFARAIHEASPRKDNGFIAVNCGGFAKELLESELFGYKAGAFTGAIKNKRGLLEEADGGTLFLDEIGDMPLELQVKLLRALESGEFLKLGDTQAHAVNIRVVAATNKNLPQMVNEKAFREDLYYRLNTFTIPLPSLNERKDDIAELAATFIQDYSGKYKKQITELSPEALKVLERHSWKGNVRELKNLIERAVILEDSSIITTNSLPVDLNFEPHSATQNHTLAEMEKRHIESVLRYTKGNKTEAAHHLGIAISTLYRKMEEYHLPKD